MGNRRVTQYSYVENNFELHRSSWLNCALRGDEAVYWVSNTDSVPPSTNHCYPILTKYTAASPRKAQLSQLE